MKKFIALGLAAALVAGSLGGSIASADARGQDRDRGGSEAAAGIAGGIFGFALGALASQPNYYYPPAPYPPVVYAPQYPAYAQNSHVAWCEQNYRSYNPSTDTYVGYDGYMHYCVASY